MAGDSSAIAAAIAAFQAAVLGKDVRAAIVQMGTAVKNAVDAQLIDVDTDLDTSGEGADAAVAGAGLYGTGDRTGRTPAALTWYRMDNLESAVTPAAFPKNSYSITAGSHLSGWGGSVFTPTSAHVYYIEKRASLYNSNVSVYLMLRPQNKVFVMGYSSDGGSTVTWADMLEPDTDAGLSVSGMPADAKAAGDALALALPRAGYFHYTDYDANAGWWGGTGTEPTADPDYPSLFHTQRFRVNPGEDIYTCYKNTSSTYAGAWFGRNGEWIAPLKWSDITAYTYKTANEFTTRSSPVYVSMYKFTAPAGAYWLSFNYSTAAARVPLQAIASKPVYLQPGAGNIWIHEGDPILQARKGKRLAVIGPSSVWIDRWQNEDAASQGYMCGFQEYLAGFYDGVDSFGYSGGAWMTGASTTYKAIYTGIVAEEMDLSGYDEFLLVSSTNGLTAENQGDYDSSNPAEYFGALAETIEYIFTQNANAVIWLSNFTRAPGYYNSGTTKALIDEANLKLAQLCDEYGFLLVDAAADAGFGFYTTDNLRYDGTHMNNAGNRAFGLCCRKRMLGI